MNKRLIIAWLLFISLLPHFSYSSGTPLAYQYWAVDQKFSKKNSVENVFGACIEQAVPIITPLVALGKCVVSWIKNRKNNKTKCNTSNKSYTPIKKQEPVYCPTVKITLPKKPIKLPCKKIPKQLLNQLSSLRGAYRKCCKLSINQSKRLSQRICALQQSLNENLKYSLYKGNWSDIDPTFIRTFNLGKNSFDLNGIKFQHVLQKEFHDMAQETALAWTRHRNNSYIQQLVEKNVTCIKSGVKHNQSGSVVEATRLADIGWAILDHIQALGEGACQGAGNTTQVFLHPIDTIQGTARGIAQCTYYLGQATLGAIDLAILAVTDQGAAHKKLQTWKQNFTELVDTISEQWQVTPSHDITKLISRFTTEALLTGKVFRSLGGLFSFARMNSAKLIGKVHKVTESISRATTPEGITTYLNKAVKHTQRTSKAGHATNCGTTKLRKTGKTIQERFEQRLQSRQSTERISRQSATELRKTRPTVTKKFVQQRRFYQPAKTEPTVKASSATELTKPKTIKKLGKKGKPPLPMKTYEGSLNNNNLQSNIIK